MKRTNARKPALQRMAGYGLSLLLALVLLSGCAGGRTADNNPEKPGAAKGDITLVIGAYSVVKDVFAELLPKFQQEWKDRTGQTVVFQESYEASGTQARSIIGGFEADVAVLAMDGDLRRIRDAGLITHDWTAGPYKGNITTSIAVIGTREGNPLGIKGWEDLMKPGVRVLYPNPQTSGGAQWDINAIYGAGLKESERQTGSKEAEFAKGYLERVHANIESLDKSGRASMAAFEYGVGDAIVTYENELIARINKGVPYDIVIPDDTILIENPAAVVDRNVDKHGTREVAEAFLEFLRSEETQLYLAENGFRPVEPSAAEKVKNDYTTPPGLFDIGYLGGWDEVKKNLYSKRGVWYQVLAGL